jgi:SAM-dependent methyltransferase
MEPCAALLLEHASPHIGDHVVDVAAGTGAVARMMAPLLGRDGRVVAVDANPAMLFVGQSLPAYEGAAIDWREGDAGALPLANGSYDLALCQHGLQYFADPVAALHEMRRVLRRGGRAAASVWRALDHNPFAHLLWGAVARQLGVTPEPFARPFSCGDAGELRRMMEVAGFAGVSVVARSLIVRQPHRPQFVAEMVEGSTGLLPGLAALDNAQRAALVRRVEEEIAPELPRYVRGEWQVVPMSLHIALGRA